MPSAETEVKSLFRTTALMIGLSFSQTPKLLINWGLPPFFRFPWSPFLSGPDYGFRDREILAKLHHLARLALFSGDRLAQRRCESSSVAICTDVRADIN